MNGEPVPIIPGKYDDGPRPRINGEGKVLDTLLLRNVQLWVVQDIEITNLGTNREPWGTGVRIVTNGLGKMRHIHLPDLFVHDVNDDLRKPHEGGGLYFGARGQ